MGSFRSRALNTRSVVVVRLNFCRGSEDVLIQSCRVLRELDWR